MKYIVVIAFGLLAFCFADVYQIQWADTISNGVSDVPCGIDIDTNNNIIVAATSTINGSPDCYIMKYDSNGTILWTDTVDYGNANDNARSVVVDQQDDIIAVGKTWCNGCKYLIIKLDAAGNLLWEDTLDFGIYEEANDVAIDSSNNILVTGVAYTSPGGPSSVTLKNDSNGILIWADTVRYGEIHHGNGVAVDDGNNVFVVSYCNFQPGLSLDVVILKYDSLGTLVYVDTLDHDGFNDSPWDVVVDNSGSVIVVGQVSSNPEYGFVIKYNSTGTILWEEIISEGAVFAVDVDSVNNIVVTGYRTTSGTNDIYTVKYDSLGVVLWQDLIDMGDDEYGQGVAFDKFGNIVVTGVVNLNARSNVYIVKYEFLYGVTEDQTIGGISKDYVLTSIMAGSFAPHLDKPGKIFDITGRQIHTLDPAPGVYFIEVDGEIRQKVVKIQ